MCRMPSGVLQRRLNLARAKGMPGVGEQEGMSSPMTCDRKQHLKCSQRLTLLKGYEAVIPNSNAYRTKNQLSSVCGDQDSGRMVQPRNCGL